jgi:hypothetical protein
MVCRARPASNPARWAARHASGSARVVPFEGSLTVFKIVEKQNPLAVHCICDTLERARHWIDTLAPLYVARGHFMDKTLTPDSFTIIGA